MNSQDEYDRPFSVEDERAMDDYCKNILPLKESQDFVEKMKNNPKLLAAFNNELMLIETGQYIHDDIIPIPVPHKKNEEFSFSKWSNYSRVAAIVGFLAVGFGLWKLFSADEKKIALNKNSIQQKISPGQKNETNNNPPLPPPNDNERLTALKNIASQHDGLYPVTQEDPALLGSLYTAIDKGKFSNVLKATPGQFGVLGREGNDNLEVNNYLNLYKAICSVSMDSSAAALKYLNKIETNNTEKNNLFYQKQWYTFLAYLKLGNKAEAEKLMNEMSGEVNHPKHKEILEITAEINKVK